MAAFEYKYRVNGLVKAPAEITGKVCKDLIDSDGAVTPARLVEVSKPKDAPLHGEFEWNNTIAAQKYREEQARQIIKNIVIIEVAEEDEEPKQVKCWVNSDRAFVPTDERLHKYVTIDTALSNESWKDNLLKTAKRDMTSFIVKYKRLTELSKIIEDMNDFLGA
ncbi:MAG: hypothetical protein J6Y78_15715 [Paludibacteraceae bacterium]|nr:hypothetical protein [Paludibacteraceae bacterium]